MNERAIFIAALDKDDPAERAAFLEQACADDQPRGSESSGCSRPTSQPTASSNAAPLGWV
jgi:hypothetical protein